VQPLLVVSLHPSAFVFWSWSEAVCLQCVYSFWLTVISCHDSLSSHFHGDLQEFRNVGLCRSGVFDWKLCRNQDSDWIPTGICNIALDIIKWKCYQTSLTVVIILGGGLRGYINWLCSLGRGCYIYRSRSVNLKSDSQNLGIWPRTGLNFKLRCLLYHFVLLP
jgi:hypothetical protein